MHPERPFPKTAPRFLGYDLRTRVLAARAARPFNLFIPFVSVLLFVTASEPRRVSRATPARFRGRSEQGEYELNGLNEHQLKRPPGLAPRRLPNVPLVCICLRFAAFVSQDVGTYLPP